MRLTEFKSTLAKTAPPSGCAPVLTALWWAGKDEWTKAHTLVMKLEGQEAAWVHAHLHRVEGDLDNARYWYREAKQPFPSTSLAQEWTAIATALLRDASGDAERK
jgi:hypothetical protein